MFEFTKKFAIAASLVALYAGQFDAFGYNNNNEGDEALGQGVVKRTATTIREASDLVPGDVWKMILAYASQDTNPGRLASVCQYWHKLMHDSIAIQSGLKFSSASDFMKQCMNLWWKSESDRQFESGILLCNLEGRAVKELKFSELTNGTFDLSTCDNNIAHDVVITTDVERFFKLRGENKNKVVILIALRHLVEQEIGSSAAPFAPIMGSWDVSKARVALFLRWGNWKNREWFDYLTDKSLAEISSMNLFENWKKCSSTKWPGCSWRRAQHAALTSFQVCFVNQNKDDIPEPEVKRLKS